ncbi:MAG: conserved rane protein of unknown function, partial [Gammaproteobacteria bacterium]|nr:conserved rane protein of unknown function [Gammaproteobacteria bacterium]
GSIPCKTDIRDLMQTLVLSRVTSPVQQQVTQFNHDCYLRAKAKFDAQKPDLSTYESIMKNYGGEADLSWMGSHVLRELYYSQEDMTPLSPIPGFPYSQYRLKSIDEAIDAGEMEMPQWGYPTCEQWWSDSQKGLERAIVKDVDADQPVDNHLGKLKPSEQAARWMTAMNPYTQTTSDDVVTRSVLYHSKGNYGGFSSDNAQIDTNPGASGIFNQGLIGMSQTISRLLVIPLKRDAIADVLPIIRACTLFFIIMFSPFVLIFGGYRFGVGVSLCCAFFILIFLDFIWAMDKYLENALLASTTDPSLGNVLIQHPTIINIMSNFYFVAAGILLYILGWAGVKVGNGLDKMLGQSQTVANGITSDVKSGFDNVLKVTRLK